MYLFILRLFFTRAYSISQVLKPNVQAKHLKPNTSSQISQSTYLTPKIPSHRSSKPQTKTKVPSRGSHANERRQRTSPSESSQTKVLEQELPRSIPSQNEIRNLRAHSTRVSGISPGSLTNNMSVELESHRLKLAGRAFDWIALSFHDDTTPI